MKTTRSPHEAASGLMYVSLALTYPLRSSFVGRAEVGRYNSKEANMFRHVIPWFWFALTRNQFKAMVGAGWIEAR